MDDDDDDDDDNNNNTSEAGIYVVAVLWGSVQQESEIIYGNNSWKCAELY
jgi:hypothetical protein